MTRFLLASLLPLLAACPPTTGLDDSGGGPSPDDTGSGDGAWTTALVTTVSSSYTTGTMAAVSLADWSVQDELFVASGDPAVSVSDGRVFQINRFGYDAVRAYEPGSWQAPLWEQALADSSNPQVARICAGAVFVTLYGDDEIAVLDPESGERIGGVDLSAWADADGDAKGPEASTLVPWEGKLYAGLNRLDREGGWVDEGGVVVEIDCEARAASRSWPAGGNTSVHPWPGGEGLLVLARAFGEDPGGVWVLDPEADRLEPRIVLDEGEAVGVAADGERALLGAMASDYSSFELHCLDLAGGAITSSAPTDAYLADMKSDDRGRAWVAQGISWVDPDAPSGLSVYDIATCAIETSQPIGLSLYPVSIDFY
jgi:hypothetical protein